MLEIDITKDKYLWYYEHKQKIKVLTWSKLHRELVELIIIFIIIIIILLLLLFLVAQNHMIISLHQSKLKILVLKLTTSLISFLNICLLYFSVYFSGVCYFIHIKWKESLIKSNFRFQAIKYLLQFIRW